MAVYDYKNKSGNVSVLNKYMYAKTLSMFEYDGLPETIPVKELEKILQQKGFCFVAEHENELYALTGSLGGEQDAYGNPTQFIVANPYLKLNKTFELNEGVLFVNDDMKMGLQPLFDKMNMMLVENDINMVVWGYNSRQQNVFTTPDDKTKQSVDTFIKKVVDGELSAITETAFFDGMKVHNANKNDSGVLKGMIEYHQYIKSMLFNEIGLSSNFNMKRERLISSELDQAEDSLFSLVYNMMSCRIEAVNKINEMFSLNIKVDFGSVWSLKNKKLVDGVPENEQTNSQPQERELDSNRNQSFDGNSELQEESEEVENKDSEQEREQEQGQSLETEPEPEQQQESELESEPEPEKLEQGDDDDDEKKEK